MKIGILGGGQLGRMLIQEALSYDDQWFTLDPDPKAPCHQISDFTCGSFNDYEEVLSFGEGKDVVSIEIEHVNVKALYELENRGIKVIPAPHIIEIIQQKILQKEFYLKNNLPSPEFQVIQKASELNFPFPFVQKLNTGGYDGKGVQVIHSQEDLHKLWDEPSVIESLVDIDKELSLIIARNSSGEVKQFPVTEMVADPKLNLLDFNICPSELTLEVEQQIEKIAKGFIEAADSAGLFAIELFLDKQGKVWINETAPRLHNSGHQSQEGNLNSQFEQMYRVLKDLPLASTEAKGFSGMLNLVGEEGYTGPVNYEGIEKVLSRPNCYVHLYGKTMTKPGRKMGHINIVSGSKEELLSELQEVKSLVKVIAREGQK